MCRSLVSSASCLALTYSVRSKLVLQLTDIPSHPEPIPIPHNFLELQHTMNRPPMFDPSAVHYSWGEVEEVAQQVAPLRTSVLPWSMSLNRERCYLRDVQDLELDELDVADNR